MIKNKYGIEALLDKLKKNEKVNIVIEFLQPKGEFLYRLFIKDSNDNSICVEDTGNKISSRTKYAKQVANIIREHHGKNDESFIFGLSGKWGAGKTTFLKILNKELQCNDDEKFIVLNISPWKFGSETTTFLRNFLKNLNLVADEEIIKDKSLLKKKIYKIWHSNFLANLDHDVSKPSFNFLNITNLFLVFIITSWVCYKLAISLQIIPWSFVATINENQLLRVSFSAIYGIVALLAIPILISRFNISTKSEKATSLDQFNQTYDEIIKKFESGKIVVFVDDLDRVSPEIARSVLDIFRTFADNKQVTFVVTGDHSVLELHIGSQVNKSGTKAEKIEEGRRYLKKMFNVYWPLPIPTDDEFTTFLTSEIEKKYEKLKTIVFSENEEKFQDNIGTLTEWLFTYFDKNFRNIIIFIETIIFNFGLVDTQLETADDDLKIQLKEIKLKPLLFIRMLMIQDLAAPVYEEYTKNPSKVRKLEEDLVDNSKRELENIIKSLKDQKILSPKQEKFFRTFIYEKPRFYEEGRGLVVHSISPFIFIALSSDFPDLRGPTTVDFMNFVENQDIDNIASALQNSGVIKLTSIKEKLIEHLSTLKSTDIPQFLVVMKTLISALKEIKNTSLIQDEFFTFFLRVDFKPLFHNSHSLEIRKGLTLILSEWLDYLPEKKDFTEYFDLLSVSEQNEAQRVEAFITEQAVFKHFSSRLACKFIVYMYEINQDKALNLLEVINADYEIIGLEELLIHKESISTEFAVHPETPKGGKLWRLIKKLSNSELFGIVTERFVEHILAGGKYHITSWIAVNYEDIEAYLDLVHINLAVVHFIKNFFNDHNNLVNHISNMHALVLLVSEQMWGEVLNLGVEDLYKLLILFESNSTLSAINPTAEQSKKLMLKMIKYSKTLGESGFPSKEAEVLEVLKKSTLWNSLPTLPTSVKRKIFPKINSSVKNMILKSSAEKVIGSWS